MRHAHKVTVAAPSKLQHVAFSLSNTEENFEAWRVSVTQQYMTFQFWDTVMRMELLSLMFVRAHREYFFELYVETLEELACLLFALDHYNYARWIPIHIHDMKSLLVTFATEFKKHWVVSKTKKIFSCMPLDQVHEQENAKVKGKGGVIGLTESPTALRRWMVCGPELANCLDEFENTEKQTEFHLHHEEGLATQIKMKQQVQSLVE